MIVFITPPGGFFVFGILMAAAAYLDLRKNKKKEAVKTAPASAEISSKEETTA
jgi:hypothetical protein